MARNTIIITEVSTPDSWGARTIAVLGGETKPKKYLGFAFQSGANDEYLDIDGYCSRAFDGTKDISVIIPWIAATDVTNAHGVRLEAYIANIVTDTSATDIAALDILAETASGASDFLATGETGDKVKLAVITILAATHGLVAGDIFAMRILRDISHADDDITGDVYIMPWLRMEEAA